MAINIFNGEKTPQKSKVNSAQASQRAQAARNALTGPSETSSSGTTAVKTGGTLQKVGNFVGKAANIASKFLPGIGGTIAKGLSNLLNDPEWWQSVPGDAITLNEPLRRIDYARATIGTGSASRTVPRAQWRFAILDVISSVEESSPVKVHPLITTQMQVTQYLMPEIRKVVNAIPLQSAEKYKTALESGAAIYAIWRQLKKMDYILKHGTTYLANLNDPGFPIFQTENAAWLQSTINRLEEYLRANVRLPHTLCEYLAWRFGRVYKSNNSAKAALVVYDVLPMASSTAAFDSAIAYLMLQISSDEAVQKANTDLYNAYYDHDFMVEVRDDTQFMYDMKEFMLRTNMQHSEADGTTKETFETLVCIDSSLDNPTAFMASTVSTIGRDPDGTYSALFPVFSVAAYMPYNFEEGASEGSFAVPGIKLLSGSQSYQSTILTRLSPFSPGATPVFSKQWGSWVAPMNTFFGDFDTTTPAGRLALANFIATLLACKALDLYNIGLYIDVTTTANTNNATQYLLDATSLSIDAGNPTLATIATEHIYAFANLVDVARKHSMSYKAAEKLVAR